MEQEKCDRDTSCYRSRSPWAAREQTAAPRWIIARLLCAAGVLLLSSALLLVSHPESALATHLSAGGGHASPFQSHIGGLTFVDDRHGWVMWQQCAPGFPCVSALARTVDGGVTWHLLPNPEHAIDVQRHVVLTFQGSALHFVTTHDGWVTLWFAGARGASQHAVLVTHDGGWTWTMDPRLATVTQLVSWGRSTWAVANTVGRLTLLTSDDGGDTWQRAAGHPIVDASSQLIRVSRRSAFLGLLATHDGGTTWQKIAGPCTAAILWGMTLAAVDDQHLWAACPGEPFSWALDPKELFVSNDAGRHWQPRASSHIYDTQHFPGSFPATGDGVREFQMFTQQQGWAVFGQWWLFGTRDGGYTWTDETPQGAVVSDGTDGLTVVFLDTRHGWLAAQDKVFRTSDGGHQWTAVLLSALRPPLP